MSKTGTEGLTRRRGEVLANIKQVLKLSKGALL